MDRIQYNCKQSGREMGLIIAAVLLAVALYPTLQDGLVAQTYVLAGFVSAVVAIIVPQVFFPVFLVWMRFASFLAMVISPIFMGVLFFGFFTPMAFVLRLCGKDLLARHPREKGKDTFWKDKNTAIGGDMNRQF